MIRRSLLAAGLLVAALAATSCSTFNHGNDVAEVNGVKLSRDELLLIAGDKTAGADLRAAITEWLKVAGVGGDVSALKDAADLSARGTAATVALSAPFIDTAKTRYEKGIDGAPALCLAAIPLAATTTPDTVLKDLAGGMSFADAAKKYSVDASFAQSGGIISDATSGSTCLPPSGFDAGLLTKLKAANATPGTPVAIDLTTVKAILLLRAFDELTAAEKAVFIQDELNAEVQKRLDAAHVSVNPKYGKWDPKTASVVALGQS